MIQKYKNNVAVVIPTLGKVNLNILLDALDQSTIKPSEVIIVVPFQKKINIQKFKHFNIRIIHTDYKHQVKQRIAGFKESNCNLVLQLDDECILQNDCLEKLISVILEKGDLSSVSPSSLDKNGIFSMWMTDPLRISNIFYNLMMFIANGSKGYQPGKMSRSGLNLGYSTTIKYPYEVDWIPGGCALHYKKNLIIENYYPIFGKSFSEDILHSYLLRKKHIKLFHVPQAKCIMNSENNKNNNFLSKLSSVYSNYKILKKLNKDFGGNSFRLAIATFIYYLLLNHIKKKLK